MSKRGGRPAPMIETDPSLKGSTMTKMTKLPKRRAGDAGYTTVTPQGAPGYVSPREPACTPDLRYMAVSRVDGGGWGIVDRRTARLLAEARPDEHRYPHWHDVQAVVSTLNRHGS